MPRGTERYQEASLSELIMVIRQNILILSGPMVTQSSFSIEEENSFFIADTEANWRPLSTMICTLNSVHYNLNNKHKTLQALH